MSAFTWLAFFGGVLLLSIVFQTGFVIGRRVSERRWRNRVRSLERTVQREQEYSIRLINTAEERVAEEIRHWWPSPEDFDEAWKQAEIMANRRAMVDANRKHLPRPDGAPAARIGRVKVTPVRLQKGKSNGSQA